MKEYKIDFSNKNYPILSKEFWIKVLIMALSIFITCILFSIAWVKSPLDALYAAIIISLLNAFLKPLLVFISLPLMLLTLGFFNLVINALIILLTSSILNGFEVNGFWDAILFSIIITFISFLLDIPQRINKLKKKAEERFNLKEKESDFTDYEDVTED